MSGLLSHACLLFFGVFPVITISLPLVGLVTQTQPLMDTPGAPAGDFLYLLTCVVFLYQVDFS